MRLGICCMFSLVFSIMAFSSWAVNTNPFESRLPVEEEEIIIKPKTEPEPEQIQITERQIDPSALDGLYVEGVFWGGSFPQAIINGEIYREDEKLESIDARILSIEQNTVKIIYFGKIFILAPKKKLGRR